MLRRHLDQVKAIEHLIDIRRANALLSLFEQSGAERGIAVRDTDAASFMC